MESPKLSLLVLYTNNIEATRDFYAAIGLSFHDEQHGKGPRHYAATLAGTVFEIYPQQGAELIGNLRLGFDVQSLDQTLTTIRRRNVTVLSEPRDSPWGRRAVVSDPNGNRVELTQHL